jgi:predicted dehydrogenase
VNTQPVSRPSPADGSPSRALPLRVAVVGLGYWGPNLVRNLQELPDADIAWLCDLRPEALDAIANRYPGVQATTSYEAVLADPDVDAVILATPISTHYPLARAALEAGKHVLVEKPLAGSSGEAAQLIEVAQEAGRTLMAGHTFLYSPPVNKIRELIAAGELGDIYFISMSRVNLGLHQTDASVIWDLGPHDFSILLYWLGEMPTRIQALGRGCVMPNTPDVAFVSLEFASGIVAHIELSWLAPSKLRRTTIVGSEKMIVYDDTSPEPVRLFDSGVDVPNPDSFGEYRLTYRSGAIVSPRIDVVEPLSLELADFCAAIRDGTSPRSDAALGLSVVRIVEGAEQALVQRS